MASGAGEEEEEWKVVFAKKTLSALRLQEQWYQNKVNSLIEDIKKGGKRGQRHPLKGELAGCFSRKITHADRLIYDVEWDTLTITIHSVEGHYDD